MVVWAEEIDTVHSKKIQGLSRGKQICHIDPVCNRINMTIFGTFEAASFC
jgi:hypothetical protein